MLSVAQKLTSRRERYRNIANPYTKPPVIADEPTISPEPLVPLLKKPKKADNGSPAAMDVKDERPPPADAPLFPEPKRKPRVEEEEGMISPEPLIPDYYMRKPRPPPPPPAEDKKQPEAKKEKLELVGQYQQGFWAFAKLVAGLTDADGAGWLVDVRLLKPMTTEAEFEANYQEALKPRALAMIQLALEWLRLKFQSRTISLWAQISNTRIRTTFATLCMLMDQSKQWTRKTWTAVNVRRQHHVNLLGVERAYRNFFGAV